MTEQNKYTQLQAVYKATEETRKIIKNYKPTEKIRRRKVGTRGIITERLFNLLNDREKGEIKRKV